VSKLYKKKEPKHCKLTNFSILGIKTQKKLNAYLFKSKEALKEKKLDNLNLQTKYA